MKTKSLIGLTSFLLLISSSMVSAQDPGIPDTVRFVSGDILAYPGKTVIPLYYFTDNLVQTMVLPFRWNTTFCDFVLDSVSFKHTPPEYTVLTNQPGPNSVLIALHAYGPQPPPGSGILFEFYFSFNPSDTCCHIVIDTFTHETAGPLMFYTPEGFPYVPQFIRGNYHIAPENWYFKPPDHINPLQADYTPSGMPDFDQKQNPTWINPINSLFSFCGPASVANCFWWFDSKYQFFKGAPGDGWDLFPLVRDYLDNLPWPPPGWLIALPPGSPGLQDDHRYDNVENPFTLWPPWGSPPDLPQPFIPGWQNPPLPIPYWSELIERLAWYMDTDGWRTGVAHTGTNVIDMQKGIKKWLIKERFKRYPLAKFFEESTVKNPDFYWLREEIKRCEDVILLLGFWELQDIGIWRRIGGHYVTSAGVSLDTSRLAFSDPFFDAAEMGMPGIIRNSPWSPHPLPIPPHSPEYHNDAGNASHDFCTALAPSPSPGGSWWLPDYLVSLSPSEVLNFQGLNVPNEFMPDQGMWQGGPVHTEIEYAVTISPRCPLIKDLRVLAKNGREQDLKGGDTALVCLWIYNPGTEACHIDSVLFYQAFFNIAFGNWGNFGSALVNQYLYPGDSVLVCEKYIVPKSGHGCIKSVLYSDCCVQEDQHNFKIYDNSDCGDKADTFLVEVYNPMEWPIELEVSDSLPQNWTYYINKTTFPNTLDTLIIVIKADSADVKYGLKGFVGVVSYIQDQIVGEGTFEKWISFKRGDSNWDTKVSVSDVVYTINYLFKGGPSPKPVLGSGEVNCDDKVTVSDVIYTINYLFKGGPPPVCK